MTIFMYAATAAWLCLAYGYTQRRNTATHVPFMLVGIFIDIALVLYLQVTRSAVQEALRFDLEVLKQIHIGFSTLALVLYFPILALGFQLVKGKMNNRTLHIRLGTVALISRTLGFLFMFSMWKS